MCFLGLHNWSMWQPMKATYTNGKKKIVQARRCYGCGRLKIKPV